MLALLFPGQASQAVGMGVDLQRASAEAGRLFALADELTAKLAAPHIHTVLITHDFNAAVSQVSRLGVFGWPHNYLLVGLPLMEALTPVQFSAVLAHELGHLSGRHGRFAGWIYRVRQTWVQLMVRLERERRWGVFIFSWFINWYAPYFNAYSFVLARRHEYEADAAAVPCVEIEGEHICRLAGRPVTFWLMLNRTLHGSIQEITLRHGQDHGGLAGEQPPVRP